MGRNSQPTGVIRFSKPLCQCDPTAEFRYEAMPKVTGSAQRYYISCRRSPGHPWHRMLNEHRRPLHVCFDDEDVSPMGFRVEETAPGVYVAFADFADFDPADEENPPDGVD